MPASMKSWAKLSTNRETTAGSRSVGESDAGGWATAHLRCSIGTVAVYALPKLHDILKIVYLSKYD